jgi:protein-tyrosine phosphatase
VIDLHSHLLPNIDDGSRSIEQSVAVLQALAAGGVTDVVLTPHTSVSALVQHLEDEIAHRDETFAILEAEAPRTPRLHLGFEVMLDREPLPSLLSDRRLTLAGSRHPLVEFRMTVRPDRAAALVLEVAKSNVVPIVAHPERYRNCSVDDFAGWKALGALLQVDATTLSHRGPRGETARKLVEAGLADLAAADNHGDGKSVAAALRFLSDRGHADVGRLLVIENPRAVLDDRELISPGPIRLTTRLSEIVRRIVRREDRES